MNTNGLPHVPQKISLYGHLHIKLDTKAWRPWGIPTYHGVLKCKFKKKIGGYEMFFFPPQKFVWGWGLGARRAPDGGPLGWKMIHFDHDPWLAKISERSSIQNCLETLTVEDKKRQIRIPNKMLHTGGRCPLFRDCRNIWLTVEHPSTV